MNEIVKKGSPEKITGTVTSREEFEQKWKKAKNQPIRCEKCKSLIATGTQDLVTLKKGAFKALANMTTGSTMDIECPRCGQISQLRF